MNRQEIINQIRTKKSYLCVGLDPDLAKIPMHLPKTAEGVLTFCKSIIDATLDHCVAYKPNAAFFEAMGWEGYRTLQEVIQYIPKTHLSIADAKRGDIGNTSAQYAHTFYETMGADALTIAPYMGEDSVKPFLEYKDKWAIILGLTSNIGSKDFEMLEIDGEYLFEKVLETCSSWGNIDNTMFVIGATQGEYMRRVRAAIPDHFLLVPGVGAQGGSLHDVSTMLMNNDIGILVNSSREIIYASSGEDYADAARRQASIMAETMSEYL